MIPTYTKKESKNESCERLFLSDPASNNGQDLGAKATPMESQLLQDINEEKTWYFGDFEPEEYEKYFSCDIQCTAVEFLCDTYNATKSWVEEGSKDNFTYLKAIESQELKSCIRDLQQNLDLKCIKSLDKHRDSEDKNAGEKTDITNDNNNNNDDGETTYSESIIQVGLEGVTESNVTAGTDDTKQAKPTSWASLFKTSPTPNSHTKKSTANENSQFILSAQMSHSAPPVISTKRETEADLSLVTMDKDDRAHKLADTISELTPNFSRHHLQLRGLINRGNWCYINTTLQTLLGIPAISHFYKALKSFLNKNAKTTATPLTDCMIQLFNEFEPINLKVPVKKQTEDLRTGAPFEPKCFYDVLPVMKTTLSEKGRQEDAEEFLSFLLNGIHDEFVALQKIATQKIPKENLTNGIHDNDDNSKDEHKDNDDSWEQVGPKNKSSVLRKAVIEESLIKHVFGGVIRSSVHQTGMKESTTLQPFFTLQLDIQSEDIHTLNDAIKSYFVKENLQGFNCSKTNTEVEASRRLSIEDLPLMFIFHLKYFVFDRKGGCQKIHKQIDIPVDLDIPKDVMSSSTENRSSAELRSYKLYAVIYHHGKHAAGGHYTASVHHGNPFGWVHFDDNVIKAVNVNQVLKHQQGCVPYLLFYESISAR